MVNDKGPPKEKTDTSTQIESLRRKRAGIHVDPLSVDKVLSMHPPKDPGHSKRIHGCLSKDDKVLFKAPTKDHSHFEGTAVTSKGSQ